MAFSSDVDPATEALIAQLMAEDLDESYQRQFTPIGASYHDYEEPLSSYERQCLEAENNPDEEFCERSGWGFEDPDEVNGAAAPDEGLHSTGSAHEGTWDSRFTGEDGHVHEHVTPGRSLQVVGADGDDDHSDSDSCSNPTNEDLTGSPARVVSCPTSNASSVSTGETCNTSSPMTLPTPTAPNIWAGPIPVPDGRTDPSQHISHHDPYIPPSYIAPNERLPAPSEWALNDQRDDGLDYSSSKGKGRAVRAYDEYKQGLRYDERESLDPDDADFECNRQLDIDDDNVEEDWVRDEDVPFIRIPWPCAEKDELVSRREDAEVVEIHVGDEETLDSILEDISLRDERRRKGKGVEGRTDCVGEQEREGRPGGEIDDMTCNPDKDE